MEKRKYEAIKSSLEELRKGIDDGTLQGEDRVKAERAIASGAGFLCSFWLPVGWGRRVIMFVLLLVGFYGLLIGKPLFVISWAIAAMFSPRIVGNVTYFFGRLARKE
jgi:hypothetical protein